MKQLLIVNSAKALKTGVADDLTALDAGQIGFFNLTPDAEGTNAGKTTFFNTAPTKNFGIALGRGTNLLPFVITEVDVNTLSVSIAEPAAGTSFVNSITIPTPVVGKTYTLVLVKNGTLPHERNTWTATVDATSTTPADVAKALETQFKSKFEAAGLNIGVTRSTATLTFTATDNQMWTLKAGDALSGTTITATSQGKKAIGDTAYVKDLAQRCISDKGVNYLYGEGKEVYPGYPDAVENVSAPATNGYVIFNLHFATKRDAGKQLNELVWQDVIIAVPKNNASITTIKTILGQPVLVNVPTTPTT